MFDPSWFDVRAGVAGLAGALVGSVMGGGMVGAAIRMYMNRVAGTADEAVKIAYRALDVATGASHGQELSEAKGPFVPVVQCERCSAATEKSLADLEDTITRGFAGVEHKLDLIDQNHRKDIREVHGRVDRLVNGGGRS